MKLLYLPSNEKYSYDNYLVAIEYSASHQFKFIMSDGEKSSDLPWTGGEGVVTKIEAPGTQVSKILVNYDQASVVTGFKFYNKEHIEILRVGVFSWIDKEILLQDGERIVGIKSRTYDTINGYHINLVLVVGKIE